MDKSKLLDIVRSKALNGADYDEILLALQKTSASPEAIKLAERSIDEYIVQYQLALQERSKALNVIIMSLFVCSLCLWILSYVSLSSFSIYFLVTFMVMLGSAWMVKKGYDDYRKPLEQHIPKKHKIKRDIERNY